MELSNSNIKKLLIFSYFLDRKLFLYFGEENPPKNVLHLIKRKLFLYFRERKP